MLRERERESLIWGKMFLQLCGGFGGVAHQQYFWLFNFSTVVVQVSHRYGRMKIRIFSLLFVEVIVKYLCIHFKNTESLIIVNCWHMYLEIVFYLNENYVYF